MSFLHAIRAELYRLLRLPGVRFALIAPALVGAMRIVLEHSSERADSAEKALEGSGLDEAAVIEPSLGNAFGPLADGLRAGGAVLTLVLLLLGALAIVRDRENGSLSLSVIACSRLQTLAAKATGLLVIQLTAAGLLFGASTLVAGQLFELGPILDEGYELATVEELWTWVYQGFGAVLPALYASSCFGLAISAFSGGTATAITCSLLPFFLFEFALVRFAALEDWIFIPYAPLLGDRSPLIKLTDVARAYANVYWKEGELGFAVMLPLLSAGALLALAWLGLRLRSTL